MAIETLPEGEQIYMERMERKVYCGPCMEEMRHVRANLFECEHCGNTYWSGRR
ncbi:hypothetical protein HYU14_03060 [Candidatus Woesearchaeota archaeon]|nr:hypothetical protein [Candidatus Woesearchaeota archaeon]